LSGFVGILNLDGAPVDRARLERMTQALSFRGPDAQEVWCDGPVGLGHTLLQVTCGPAVEKQPAQLNGNLWIVADARIDARTELIRELKSRSRTAHALSLSTPDAELILHAYEAWGESCFEHLLGDFSFAIWDTLARRLFCARDHFGVKLFYYARVGSLFIFSNTLDCLRRHPAVPSRLNDLAIADFLLFDANQDPATTSFADIQRLPPAHILKCEQRNVSTRRYWELSVTTPIHYARDAEYVERFGELLDTSVADRLRTQSVGVLMSGGLDSSTVAASAQRILSRTGHATALHAHTEIFHNLIPHEEHHYAGLVADALKIPIEFLVSDHWQLFDRLRQPDSPASEPAHLPCPDTTPDQLRQIAVRSRVALTGNGGDAVLCGRISVHFRQLLHQKRFLRAIKDAARFLGAEGRFSRLYLRTRWRILFASKGQSAGYPGWLNEDLERRLGLRDRWEFMNRAPSSCEAVRPEAHEGMLDSTWTNLFESCDAGSTGLPVEVRHPFFDLRLVNHLLAIPRLPWCSDKELLRQAGRGILPEAVRLRRKSPLQCDPLIALLTRPEAAWVDRFEPVVELGLYVVRDHIPRVFGEMDSWTAWMNLRPLSLNLWLRNHSRYGKK
jgi:asparagine synthase (glutamine-hydrolysing)